MSMIGQFTPARRADDDVLPFRLIMLNDRGEGRETSAVTSVVIGVSDGSNRRFDDSNHALSGEPIRLQPGSIVQVEVGEAIVAPGALRPSANGLAMNVDSAGDVVLGLAIEDAADANEVIRIWLNPELTI